MNQRQCGGFLDAIKSIFLFFYSHTDAIDLSPALEKQQAIDLSADISAGQPKDKLLYVYTSGTTGLPKAAVITNLR